MTDVPADDLLEALRLSIEQARSDRPGANLVRADSPFFRSPVPAGVVDLDSLPDTDDTEAGGSDE